MKLLDKYSLPIYVKKYLKGEGYPKEFYGSEKDKQIIFCYKDEVSWLPRFEKINIPKEYDGFGRIKLSNIGTICEILSVKYWK